MCHLILLLPIVALPVFWLMPPVFSIPIYAVTLVLSGWIYALAIKAMRLPQVADDARLKSTVGRVLSIRPRGRCRVEVLGESWEADSPEHLKEGDSVKVTGRDGLRLHVERWTPLERG